MKTEELKKKVGKAKELSKGLDEPYKSIFDVIFESLLSIINNKESLVQKSEGVSIIDFLTKRGINTHSNIIIAMAHYLYKIKDVDPFNLEDIKKLYSEARIKTPKNISDIIKKKESMGYLMLKGKKNGLKAWGITLKGIRYFENFEENKGEINK